MTRRPKLGKRQAELLFQLGIPAAILMTPSKASASLVKLGLLRSDQTGGCCITPAGLRALADELEAGRVEDGLTIAARRRETKH